MEDFSSPLKSRKVRIESSGILESRRRWETEAERQIYSSKLMDAFRHLRRAKSDAKSTKHVVRDTANRVLALSARGKTRWSRAILNRLRRRNFNKTHKKASAAVRKPNRPPCRPFQRRVNVLSRLIPGCRKVSLLSLLEETTDYISALQMQVKAMASLTAVTAQINVAT